VTVTSIQLAKLQSGVTIKDHSVTVICFRVSEQFHIAPNSYRVCGSVRTSDYAERIKGTVAPVGLLDTAWRFSRGVWSMPF